MSTVVLDTDVASAVLRRRTSTTLASQLAAKTFAISFVTVGELTKWTLVRNWGPQRKAGMQTFLSRLVVLPYTKPWLARGESFRPTPSSGADRDQPTTRGSRRAAWSAGCHSQL